MWKMQSDAERELGWLKRRDALIAGREKLLGLTPANRYASIVDRWTYVWSRTHNRKEKPSWILSDVSDPGDDPNARRIARQLEHCHQLLENLCLWGWSTKMAREDCDCTGLMECEVYEIFENAVRRKERFREIVVKAPHPPESGAGR
jgi:hypothetical protein